MALEIDDGVSDQLPGPMKGYVTAALDLEQLDPFALQEFRRGDEVFLLRCPPECDDGRMLQEQEDILRNRSGYSVASDIAL